MPAQPQEKQSHGILCGLVRKHIFFLSVFFLTELFSRTSSAGCKNSCVCLDSKSFFVFVFFLKEQKKFVVVEELISLSLQYSKFNTVCVISVHHQMLFAKITFFKSFPKLSGIGRSKR